MKQGVQESVAPPAGKLTAGVMDRGGICCISGLMSFTNCTRVIPKAEMEWVSYPPLSLKFSSSGISDTSQFLKCNKMDVYNAPSGSLPNLVIEDAANAVALRAGIATQFDEAAFTFVPRSSDSRVSFIQNTPEYAALLHDHTTGRLTVPPILMYARFAWAVFRNMPRQFVEMEGVMLKIHCEETVKRVDVVHAGGSSLPGPSRLSLSPSAASRPSLGRLDLNLLPHLRPALARLPPNPLPPLYSIKKER